MSATYRLPVSATAMPSGPLKLEAAARVLTVPELILRIRELPVSATYRLPALSTATPRGPSNFAVAAGPFVLPVFGNTRKEACANEACNSGGRARVDLADQVVPRVRDVDVAGRIQRHARRMVEFRLVAGAVKFSGRPAHPGKGRHGAARRDFPYDVVSRVRDIDVFPAPSTAMPFG